MKIPLSLLNFELGQSPDLFIGATSYERRCISVAESLNPDKIEKIIIIENEDFSTYSLPNTMKFRELFSNNQFVSVPVRSDNPFLAVDNFLKDILPSVEACKGMCLIDITTFTHEQLLILIRLLHEATQLPQIKMVYTGAGGYSTNISESDEIWLSKGAREARSVLGYPGLLLPSKLLHLIVLVGFEAERAERLIEIYEPARLSLGIGKRSDAIREDFHQKNKEFFHKVEVFVESLSVSLDAVEKFEFSCVDPQQTKSDLLAQTSRYPEYNIAVCPMNTKPSTVGTALAALENERMQLVYCQPVEYNIEGYSTPGNECTLIDFSALTSRH